MTQSSSPPLPPSAGQASPSDEGGSADDAARAVAREFRPPAIPGVRSDATQPHDVGFFHSFLEAPRAVLGSAIGGVPDLELPERPASIARPTSTARAASLDADAPVAADATDPTAPPDATDALGDERELVVAWPEEIGAPPRYDDSDEGDPLLSDPLLARPMLGAPVSGAPVPALPAALTAWSAAPMEAEAPHALQRERGEHIVDDADDPATVEGMPLVDDLPASSAFPPAAGEFFHSAEGLRIDLEEALGEQQGVTFYRARLQGEERPMTALWSEEAPPEVSSARVPDPRLVRPRATLSVAGGWLRVFERPRGYTALDYLGEGPDRQLPAMAAIELGIQLAEVVESLHGAGLRLYDIDPSQVVIEQGGRVRYYAVHGLYPPGRLPEGPLGAFCAPEVRRRWCARIGLHSDVYALALLVYALLARRAPLDAHVDPNHLPSPRVFRPECPLGIWPYLAPALAADPMQRTPHAAVLRRSLQRARARLLQEMPEGAQRAPLALEAWAELHVGLGKARRGANQQDRALSVTTEDGRVGLYLIADGVSRSRYGDGAFAAEQVESSALARWDHLERGGAETLRLSHAQRADVLRQISRTATRRIAQEVNRRCGAIPNEPNQVMSSTLVAAFVAGDEATIANLGDSRAYLVRDQTLERITIDHDRYTDALRMGLGFQRVGEVRMAAALTRVVGRVSIDFSGQCRPEPFDPEIFRVRLLPGDRILLCSDGISDFVAGAGASQAAAEQVLLQCLLAWDDPARAAFELVVLANRAGGHDNVSCVVIALRDAAPAPDPL